MITTTSASAALKSYYLDAVTEQLNKSANPFLAQIESTTEDVWGKDVKKVVTYGVHSGVCAGKEDAYLTNASSGDYAQLTSTLKNLYGRIEISDKAVRASRNGDGSFINLVNEEMQNLVRSSSFNLGRMLFGDGTGKLAEILSVSGNSYIVDDVRNFATGMIVDLYNASGSSFATDCKVTAVDSVNRLVTITGNASPGAIGYGIYVHGSFGQELTGLGAIFSDSSELYGLSRADHDWLNPIIEEGVESITELAVQKAIDEVEERSGGKINFIICSWGVRRALINVLSKYRECNSIDLVGGARAISFNGIPVVADRFCPKGTMYLLNTDDFRLHQLCDWQWLEGDNGVLKQLAGRPVYEATLVKYAELMCYRPCGQAVLRGITEK